MNNQFVIIAGGEAHISTGRVATLDTARSLAGPMDFVYNSADKRDFGRFLEGPTPGKLSVYGPMRKVIVYPVAATN